MMQTKPVGAASIPAFSPPCVALAQAVLLSTLRMSEGMVVGILAFCISETLVKF